MDPEEGFNRYRYKTRVQVVAIIDILVGTIPFIKLTFSFNDRTLSEDHEWFYARETLVAIITTILIIYVLQLIMGIWLLAATRECYYEYTVGNCQVWYYIAMFTFFFYIGEMGYDIHVILKPQSKESVSKVIQTMLFHAAKIIYRAISLMTVNNFLYDLCRPVYKYLSHGSFMYTSYYNYRLGIPPPTRRRRLSSVTMQMNQVKRLPQSSTYQQPSRSLVATTAPRPTGAAQFCQPIGFSSSHISPCPIPPLLPSTPATTAVCAPSTAIPLLPVYNSTKVPLQPIPNHNFYFTYPQPKPKQYRDAPYDMSVNNNYPYYYTMVTSMRQPQPP